MSNAAPIIPPTYLRPSEWELTMGPILVATDGSDRAKRAVEAAARAAGALDTDPWILHVMDRFPDDDAAQFAATERSTMGEAIEPAASAILTRAKSQTESAGAHAVHIKCCSGDCAQGITETIRGIGAAAIFVGRRGRGRLGGLLLGSVSQKLASLAPCIVVIVP